jgi:hypothetical protein
MSLFYHQHFLHLHYRLAFRRLHDEPREIHAACQPRAVERRRVVPRFFHAIDQCHDFATQISYTLRLILLTTGN